MQSHFVLRTNAPNPSIHGAPTMDVVTSTCLKRIKPTRKTEQLLVEIQHHPLQTSRAAKSSKEPGHVSEDQTHDASLQLVTHRMGL